ncbi:MAG: metal-dependent transcriptional regulator [Thermoplasmata archaeon]|nr:metal-dependent transcriptional regulator [Thermoplasmata archaeon]
METLQRLTRRQLDALRAIGAGETPEKGVALNQIAAALRVQAPSALGHVSPLEVLGLVSRHRGKSRLTAGGRTALVEYQRHHRVAESLFSRLGLAPEESCTAAREVDLAISHATVERVCAAEGHPSVCPHGAPITPCSSPKGGR